LSSKGTALPSPEQEIELEAYAKRLSPYKFPRWIEFVDMLPKNATGKIERCELRLWANRASS